MTTEHLNISTNGYITDVECELSVAPQSGHLLLKGEKLTHFTATNLINGEIILIIEDTKMTSDSLAFTCTNKQISESIELDLKVIPAISTNPPDKFALNPSAPTAFNSDVNLNLEKLREYFPLHFKPANNDFIEFVRIKNTRLRRDTNQSEVEEPKEVSWNGYNFEVVDNFTTDYLNDIFIHVVDRPESPMETIKISLDVGAPGIPTVPFTFDAYIAKENNQTLLPYYGLSLNEIGGEPSTNKSENVTTETTMIENDLVENLVKSVEEPRNLAPSQTSDSPEVQTSGLLLYVVPSAIIFVLLLVFVIVVVFTR